jgi:hypothetical protein
MMKKRFWLMAALAAGLISVGVSAYAYSWQEGGLAHPAIASSTAPISIVFIGSCSAQLRSWQSGPMAQGEVLAISVSAIPTASNADADRKGAPGWGLNLNGNRKPGFPLGRG